VDTDQAVVMQDLIQRAHVRAGEYLGVDMLGK
jgi:hypothetical protein